MRRLTRYGVIVAAGMIAAGCTAGSQSSSSSGSGNGTKAATNSSLTISNESGQLWSCGFNPLNPSFTMLSYGFIYEPLVYVNPLQQGKTTPMLASSYKWGAGNKSLTFTIRSGVKWSDGTPMTANDVAFTFNLTKKNQALDLTGAWSVLSSVTASGNTVTMNFSKVAVPYFYYIADQVPIVPEHVFSKMSNPVTDPVKAPIGTGPFTMSKCTPQNITYKANPNYWQPGLPKVKTIQYPAYTSNNTANDDLANGSAQWGGQYIPGIKAFYTVQEPELPLLVPADGQRHADPEPDRPSAQEREGAPGHLVRDQPEPGLHHRRVRLRAAREPDRHRHAHLLLLAEPVGAVGLGQRLRPGQGEVAAGAGRLPHVRRGHDERGRAEAVLHREQHRRLLRLGGLHAGDPAEPRRGRHQAHPAQPVEPRPSSTT